MKCERVPGILELHCKAHGFVFRYNSATPAALIDAAWEQHCAKYENPPKSSILAEAEATINGPRREAYGDVRESFTRIAAVWSVVLRRPVTDREVALCMIGLKLCRELNRPGRDNLVDIAGYAALLEQLNVP